MEFRIAHHNNKTFWCATTHIFFNDRPEIPHPSVFIKHTIVYQIVWNTAQLIHAAVTWILNKQSWLMNVPCSTKVNNHHTPHCTFQELYQAKVAFICNEFNARMKNEWNKNWIKLAAGILLVYIQDEIYFLNKQCKRKIPYPRPVLFSFPAWQKTSWWMHFNCWAKCILFWSVM